MLRGYGLPQPPSASALWHSPHRSRLADSAGSEAASAGSTAVGGGLATSVTRLCLCAPAHSAPHSSITGGSSVASSCFAVGLPMIDTSCSVIIVSWDRSQPTPMPITPMPITPTPVIPLRPTILAMRYPRMIKARLRHRLHMTIPTTRAEHTETVALSSFDWSIPEAVSISDAYPCATDASERIPNTSPSAAMIGML